MCVAALVAVVVPLAILQIPDAIAWSLPAGFTVTRPNALASLLRAAGLALPAMAVAVPFAGLAIRRFRAGPVLLAGLLAIGAADALGQGGPAVLLIDADRSLHGLGAGVSMAAVAAVVAERRGTTRLLAGWWACAVVCALAAAPVLMRHRVSAGGWRAALQPYPWLAGVALALAALYAILAEGTARTAVRSAFPAAERSLLALLAAPVAGMCAVAVVVTYRGHHAVIAAAIADTIALAGVVVMTARAGTAGRLAAVCAVVGFTVAPAAGALTSLTQPGWKPACAALAAAICGAALVLTRRPSQPGPAQSGPAQSGPAQTRPAQPRSARTATTIGLGLAAAAFGAAALAGSTLTSTGVLALLCVPLVGGLTAALTAALRGAGTGGALFGTALLLAGVLGGYLAAGAVRVQAQTAVAAHAALSTTTILAAVITATGALVMAVAPARRETTRTGGSGAPPVGQAGGTPDRG